MNKFEVDMAASRISEIERTLCALSDRFKTGSLESVVLQKLGNHQFMKIAKQAIEESCDDCEKTAIMGLVEARIEFLFSSLNIDNRSPEDSREWFRKSDKRLRDAIMSLQELQ